MTLNILSLLAGEDVDLHAFTAKEATIPAIAAYHGGTDSVTPVLVRRDALGLNANRSVELSLPDTELSVRQRFNDVFQSINAYAPDLVIFVGFMSPLIYRLHAQYPVVGLSVHAVPPAVPVDVWLSAGASTWTDHWRDVPRPQCVSFPFRFWPAAPFEPVARASIGIPDDAVVLITTGFRLNAEIVAPWSTRMLDFVDARPTVHWLVMGVPTGEGLDSLPQHARIHLLDPRTVLQAWLAMADIYVNPPRIGGGGSVAMAMEQGTPVVTYAGGDGGDKVGDFAAMTDDAYVGRLTEWVSDATARGQAGSTLLHRFRERLDISGAPAAAGLMQACELAIAAFHQRQASNHG